MTGGIEHRETQSQTAPGFQTGIIQKQQTPVPAPDAPNPPGGSDVPYQVHADVFTPPEITYSGEGMVPATITDNGILLPSETIELRGLPRSAYQEGTPVGHDMPIPAMPGKTNNYDHLKWPYYESGSLKGFPAHYNADGSEYVNPNVLDIRLHQ